ncbi:MAG: tetratricopeptide repeat protein [Sulfurovum sp.]|nr:tetratricopeptide repeat protein [Sulfurovum sp.]
MVIKNKKINKLIKDPDLFFKDFFIKRPQIKDFLEEKTSHIKSHKYHYAMYLKYKRFNFQTKAEMALMKAISLNPLSEYYFLLGNRFIQKKQWWQAVESYKKAIKLSDTDNPKWYKEYALALMQMNNYVEASKAWETALEKSKDANDWFMYGWSLEKEGQEDESNEAYSKAIEYDKDKNAKLLGMGIFYEKKGYWIEASQAYAKTVQLNPLDAIVRYRYALSLDRCYKWAEAEEEYMTAISLQPETIDWYYRLGFVRERQEKYEEAAQAYMHAAHNRKTHTPYWYYRLGTVLEKAGYYKESNEAFLMMEKIELPQEENDDIPFKDRDVFFHKKANTLVKSKQWWQAVEAYKEAIKLSDTDNPKWYKEYALALMQMNNYVEASKAWETALEKSKDANDWFMYGWSLEKEGQEDESNEAYSKAIEYDKDKNAKLLGIGIFYEKKGYWIEASQAYAKTVQLNPLDAIVRYRYALSLDRCYKRAEAEEEYMTAISLQPETIDWYYRLGFVRERQEKYEEAAQAYMHAAHNRKTHTPYWYYRLGAVLKKAGYYKESNEAFLMMEKIELPQEENDETETFSEEPVEETVKEYYSYRNYIEKHGYLTLANYFLDENTTKKDIFEMIFKDKVEIDEQSTKEFLEFLLDNTTTKLDIWKRLTEVTKEENE